MSAFCEPVMQHVDAPRSIGIVVDADGGDAVDDEQRVAPRGSPRRVCSIGMHGGGRRLAGLHEHAARRCGCSASACSICRARTARPHSTRISIGLRPKVVASLLQRSPNLPPLTTTTSSPGAKQLLTDASIAPVPDDGEHRARPARSGTAPGACSRTSAKSALNCGVRWWNIGCAIARRTRAGTGVGPGASNNCLITTASRVRCGQSPSLCNARGPGGRPLPFSTPPWLIPRRASCAGADVRGRGVPDRPRDCQRRAAARPLSVRCVMMDWHAMHIGSGSLAQSGALQTAGEPPAVPGGPLHSLRVRGRRASPLAAFRSASVAAAAVARSRFRPAPWP